MNSKLSMSGVLLDIQQTSPDNSQNHFDLSELLLLFFLSTTNLCLIAEIEAIHQNFDGAEHEQSQAKDCFEFR